MQRRSLGLLQQAWLLTGMRFLWQLDRLCSKAAKAALRAIWSTGLMPGTMPGTIPGGLQCWKCGGVLSTMGRTRRSTRPPALAQAGWAEQEALRAGACCEVKNLRTAKKTRYGTLIGACSAKTKAGLAQAASCAWYWAPATATVCVIKSNAADRNKCCGPPPFMMPCIAA